MSAALISLTSAQRRNFEWLQAPHLTKIISVLEAVDPNCVRYVGGCVRDSLLGQQPKDIDLATQLSPEQTVKALEAAGLRAVPTGIEHGTITAIADHQGVEITSLRADVSTDGRRATVAFTRDWETDARRRDFRMNAIYLTPDSHLYDPVGGLDDIADKRVQFIGDAQQRIREDYLRILRFFRFTARFSSAFDPVGLVACGDLKAGISSLSAERIGTEFMSILALPTAIMALEAMQECGVLKEIWDAPPSLNTLARLKAVAPTALAPIALAALFGNLEGNSEGTSGGGIGTALRLSNAEKSIRRKAILGMSRITPGLSETKSHRLIYELGTEVFCDAVLISYANDILPLSEYQHLTKIADQWMPPVFPVSGRHIIAAGVTPGPSVAVILSKVEEQWIDEGFPDRERVLALINEIVLGI